MTRKRSRPMPQDADDGDIPPAPRFAVRITTDEYTTQSIAHTRDQLAKLREKLTHPTSTRPASHVFMQPMQSADVCGVRVSVPQSWSESNDSTGMVLWEAAPVLVQVLRTHGHRLLGHTPWREARVVELGCGVGCLSSLAAVLLGARCVVATDVEAVVPRAEGLLQRYIPPGRAGAIAVLPYSWGAALPAQQQTHSDSSAGCAPMLAARAFDLVLGSDILYDASTHLALLRSAVELCSASGVCVFAYRLRKEKVPAAFERAARQVGRVWHLPARTWRGVPAPRDTRVLCLSPFSSADAVHTRSRTRQRKATAAGVQQQQTAGTD